MLKISRCLPAAYIALHLAAAIPSDAATVTVNGSPTFFDGFESGNFNNPTGGSWSLLSQNGDSVTNAVSPGPFQGSFYAQLFRDDTNLGGTLEGLIGSGATGITSGDVLLRFMVYIPTASDGDARGQFRIESGNRGLGVGDFSTARAWIRPNGAGFVEAIGPGFAILPTTVPYATNTWQEWDLDYVVGSSTFSFSVNGVARSGLSSLSSGNVDFIEFDNGIASSGSVFLDSVAPPVTLGAPEPATWGCALSGLALLLWRRRSRGAEIILLARSRSVSRTATPAQ